jgi:hypothetical protein
LPGEWLSADLGLTKTDEAVTQLRTEYKRKMDEDTVRVKKMRQQNKSKKEKGQNDKEDAPPMFDYGQLLVNDSIKIDLFKEIVSEFRTPQRGATPGTEGQMALPEADKLKGYMHVCSDMSFPEAARIKAREKIIEMLKL